MKLSEEMEGLLTSAPMTNGDILPEEDSLRLGGSSPKPFEVKGKNGVQCPVETISNGNVSHDSPADNNSDADIIGIEVESYSNFTTLLPDSSSSDKFDSCKSKRKTELQKNHSEGADNSSDNDKLLETSFSETENDSSRVSEEFQLRLSDEEEMGEKPQDRLVCTPDKADVSGDQCHSTHEDDSELSAGSGTVENIQSISVSLTSGIPCAKDSNVQITEDCDQTNSAGVPNLGLDTKEIPLKDITEDTSQTVKKICKVDGNVNNSESSKISQCPLSCSNLSILESSEENEEEAILLAGDKLEKLDAQTQNSDTPKPIAVREIPSTESSELSLEDKMEAELEAELQAEIAAQRESEEHVKAIPETLDDEDKLSYVKSHNSNEPQRSPQKVVEANSPTAETVNDNDSPGIESRSGEKQSTLNIKSIKNQDKIDDVDEDQNLPKSDNGGGSLVKVRAKFEETEPLMKTEVKTEPKAKEENLEELKNEINEDIKPDLKSEVVVKIEPNTEEVLEELSTKIDVEVKTEIKTEVDVKMEQKRKEEMSCSGSQKLSEVTIDASKISTDGDVIKKGQETRIIDSDIEFEYLKDKDEMRGSYNELSYSADVSKISSNREIDNEARKKEISNAGLELESRKGEDQTKSPTTVKSLPASSESSSTPEDVQLLKENVDAEIRETDIHLPVSKDVIHSDKDFITGLKNSPSLPDPKDEDISLQREVENHNASEVEEKLLESDLQGKDPVEQISKPAIERELSLSDDNFEEELSGNKDLGSSVSPSQATSESNSVSENDSDRDFHEESDNSLCVENIQDIETNENYDSNSMCGNDSEGTDGKAVKEIHEKIAAGLSKVSSSELGGRNVTKPSNYCDTTVLDTSSSDDMDSQDCSSSISETNIAKGYSTDFCSRKRMLSHSDDESCDSYRSKKLNGLSERHTGTDASNASDILLDSGHKRPAEANKDSDSKKLRVSIERSKTDKRKKRQKEEKERHKTQETSNVSTADPLQKTNSFQDLSFDRIGATSATASVLDQQSDLPFLKKLHKSDLSKMSRSDLEELVLQKICEAITERSKVGELRLRCQALLVRQEKENEKFNKLRKQMTELSLVMKKYMEVQLRNPPATPIKVTRSVGLQVCQVPKAAHTCNAIRTKLPQSPSGKQSQPMFRPQCANPPRTDSAPEISCQRTPGKAPRIPTLSPRTNTVTSSDPPALVLSGTQNAIVSMPSKPSIPSPHVQVPPLHQITGSRPRLSFPSPSPPTIPLQAKVQPSPVRQSPPQIQNRLNPVTSDVEVIDIEKDEQNKRPAGFQISPHQHQHQQKQAANAAAQSLAGNSGMTVRLVAPTQVSQAGMIASSYPQSIVPSQGMRQKMILTSTPQGYAIRGLVVKGPQTANVLIPVQSNTGATVSTGVVNIPSSAQSAVQQIFTNAGTGNRTSSVATARSMQQVPLHPAPLPTGPPNQATNPAWRSIPPKPNLKIQHSPNGIVLSWNMQLGPTYADIESYQLYAYQEGTAPPSAGLWKKVGDVKALPLPMACTLTQFVEGHRYHFTVRAVDKHGRVGPFSQQGSICLGM